MAEEEVIVVAERSPRVTSQPLPSTSVSAMSIPGLAPVINDMAEFDRLITEFRVDDVEDAVHLALTTVVAMAREVLNEPAVTESQSLPGCESAHPVAALAKEVFTEPAVTESQSLSGGESAPPAGQPTADPTLPLSQTRSSEIKKGRRPLRQALITSVMIQNYERALLIDDSSAMGPDAESRKKHNTSIREEEPPKELMKLKAKGAKALVEKEKQLADWSYDYGKRLAEDRLFANAFIPFSCLTEPKGNFTVRIPDYQRVQDIKARFDMTKV